MRLGHEVVAVADGGAAVEALLAPDGPRFAILDWMMPSADGLSVCRAIRRHSVPYVYVMLLTVRDRSEDVIAGLDAGADDFLTKPFDPVELRARLRSGERVVELQERLLRQITDRELAEGALAESEERYRVLFERNPHPMWVYDVDSLEILAVNDTAVTRYGYSRDEFLGMSLLDLYPDESRAEVRRIVTDLSGTVRDLGVRTQCRKDGGLIQAEVTTHDLSLTDRRARMVLSVDVTERKSLEEQLRQAQKMEAVGRLAGGIAHDFNNILAVIIGYSDILGRELEDSDPRLQRLQQIQLAADRAATLTRQLLAFSRKQVLKLSVLDVNEVLSGIGPMLRRLIGADVHLAVVLGKDVAPIRADAGQIDQVILNLAVNARDAMPKGGKLTLQTDNAEVGAGSKTHLRVAPGRYVVLTVSDTGVGMDAETRAHIFEPFFTTKPIGQGTGLGLATVYGIVSQSGGSVVVDTEPGRGTTFKIYLPRFELEREPVVSADPPPARPRGGSETILLVEDETSLMHLNSEVLRGYGYNVLAAGAGDQALAMADRCTGPIDLLVTDVVMPGLSGSALAGQLLEGRPHTKIVYVSGYASDALVHHGVSESTAAFLEKPFTPRALAGKVREVLDGR